LRFQNIQSDTEMRKAISRPDEDGKPVG
jgi:uncharacterized protein YqfA (UPF0365 family)